MPASIRYQNLPENYKSIRDIASFQDNWPEGLAGTRTLALILALRMPILSVSSGNHMELRLMAQPKNQTPHAFVKACRQALSITVAAAVLGLSVNALRPQGLDLIRSSETVVPVADSVNSDGPQPIELTAALERLKQGNAIFMDARSEYDYNTGHIQTARNYPEKTLDIWMPDFFNNTPPESLLITYCSDTRCHLAEHLSAKLYEFGYTNVHHMTAGWDGWLAAGYPVESDPTFTNTQSMNQTTDCSSGECSDAQTSPVEAAQSTQ